MSNNKKYEKEYKVEAVKLSRKIGKGQIPHLIMHLCQQKTVIDTIMILYGMEDMRNVFLLKICAIG